MQKPALNHLSQLFIPVILCFLFVFPGRTQGITTATMFGQVTDETGQPVPGATVMATHQPTSTKYGIATRSDGRYNLPNLRIGGPYTVEVSFIGYESVKSEDIFLNLGETKTVDFQLKTSATELSEVVIYSGSESANKDQTGAESTFNNEMIRTLPTITRSASDIYRLTPASDGNSFAGRNDQYNNFSLNGSIFNNPFGLDAATPGGQTDAQPISLDAIDQIQVSLAPFDVTQSGFTGASINAVTKSGTNKLSGSVFGYYRNDRLTGSKLRGNKILVPDLTQLQTGISIGGPVIKDKLFFFANFELERRDDLGSSFKANRPGLTGVDISRVDAADLEAVSNALRTRFDYETGPYEGYIHETNNQKGIIKLDWNLGKSHSLTAIYNFLDASKEKPAHPSAIGRRGPDATTLQFYNSGYRINNKINSALLEVKSLFNNKLSNKLQIGYTVFDDSRDPFSTPFPVININNNGIRYIVAGHEPFSIHNTLNQKVFQASDIVNFYSGSHIFTVGTTFEKFSFDNSFNLDAYGGTFSPGFASVTDFINEVTSGNFDDDVLGATNAFNNNNANNTWALAETNVGQWAAFVQDSWLVTENFTATLGIRMDLPLYFDTSDKIQENIDRNCCYDPMVTYFDENGNATTFNSTDLPDQKPLISPRLGLRYEVGRNKTTILRGGSGLFTGRFPFVWIGNQVANPNFFFYNMTAKDFKFPQVWRTNMGLDKNFGKGWSISTDLIFTKDINAMMVRNYGIANPTGNLQGVDNRPVYTSFNRALPYQLDAYVFTNTDIGRTFNMTYEVKRSWPQRFFTSISYNYLDAQDASSIEAEISSDAYARNPALGNVNKAALAPSLYGNKHRIVGLINKKFIYGGNKLATTFSLYMEYAKGGRFSYTYSGDINGDGSALNDLILIPTPNQINFMNFAGATAQERDEQRQALEMYIQQDDYLSSNRGKYAEKYALLSPWFSRYDLRILQDFNPGKIHKIQFSIDILNFGNLISSRWGVRQYPTNTQPIGVTVDAAGNPTYYFDPSLKNTFTYDASLLSRWQMQFGLRYSF